MRGSRAETDAAGRFDAWSRTYEGSFTWKHFFAPVHEAFDRDLGEVRGAAVLDVGCGTGDMLRRLASRGAARAVGLDSSGGMIEAARVLCESLGGIELHQGSAVELPFRDEEFDLVTSCIAFHHFPDPARSIAEMARVLRPGGRLYICDMSGEGLRGKLMLAYGRASAKDNRYYDRGELSRLLSGSGLEPRETRFYRFFPRALMVSAVKPGPMRPGT